MDVIAIRLRLTNLMDAYLLRLIGADWDMHTRSLFLEELEIHWLTMNGVTPGEGVDRAQMFVDKWVMKAKGGVA